MQGYRRSRTNATLTAHREGKTLIPEYCQVPLKTGDVGKVYPHFIEIQDLFKETKEGKP